MRKKYELSFHLIQVHQIFQDADPETALEDVIDRNLEASYPMENVYKVRLDLDTYKKPSNNQKFLCLKLRYLVLYLLVYNESDYALTETS